MLPLAKMTTYEWCIELVTPYSKSNRHLVRTSLLLGFIGGSFATLIGLSGIVSLSTIVLCLITGIVFGSFNAVVTGWFVFKICAARGRMALGFITSSTLGAWLVLHWVAASLLPLGIIWIGNSMEWSVHIQITALGFCLLNSIFLLNRFLKIPRD